MGRNAPAHLRTLRGAQFATIRRVFGDAVPNVLDELDALGHRQGAEIKRTGGS